MGSWILVFYLSGYMAGGPATANFADKKSCEEAALVIKKAFSVRFEGYVCVDSGQTKR